MLELDVIIHFIVTCHTSWFLNRDPLSREQSFQEFQRVAGFPGVLGVLDCVQVHFRKCVENYTNIIGQSQIALLLLFLCLQVTIKAPTVEDLSYVNKKGFHSVGCQLVCNAQGLLLSAETNWPGGLKATDILERSSLNKQMQHAAEGWLLGETEFTFFQKEQG